MGNNTGKGNVFRTMRYLYMIDVINNSNNNENNSSKVKSTTLYNIMLLTESDSTDSVSNGVNTRKSHIEVSSMNKETLFRQVEKLAKLGSVSLENFKFEKNNNNTGNIELVATNGSFKRFSSCLKPVVIIKEYKDKDTERTIGYLIANSKGQVRKISESSLKSYCKNIISLGSIPIQNAQFVTSINAIRGYVENQFPIEYIYRKKNEHSIPATPTKNVNSEIVKEIKTEMDSVADEKALEKAKKDAQLEKLRKIYTDDQIKELFLARKNKVQIQIIANPKLSAGQMRIIWQCEARGFRARVFASPEYSIESMRFLAAELENKTPINEILNPAYTPEQMFQIQLGVELGLNVSSYSHPDNSASEMEIRVKELEADMWNKDWSQIRVIKGSN